MNRKEKCDKWTIQCTDTQNKNKFFFFTKAQEEHENTDLKPLN